MQKTQTQNYKSILKGSAVFGGTQLFTILLNLFRAKAIAVFLGPAGMGVSSLLTAAANMIQQLFTLGINLTTVKDVAQLPYPDIHKTGVSKLSQIRLLFFILATIGTLFCVFFAPQLSQLTFGNLKYSSHFRLMGIFIFFTIISTGELSILQGQKKLKVIAVGSLASATVGLILGVPLYYFFKIEGIVPGMIAISLCSYFTFAYQNRENFSLRKIFFPESDSEFFKNSNKMIGLGLVLMISTLIGTLITYLLNLFITKNGGVNDVGFFQAANSMTNQYMGLVFTAMALDYFPRLAAVSHEKEKINELVNSQLEIVLFLVAPIITIFMFLSPFVVKLLLTSKFLLIVPVLNSMALGVFFKAAAYPLGYISFAKGDKKTFFWLEGIFSNLLQLSLNILFYHYFGLAGLGYSFIIIFMLYLIIITAVTNKIYQFTFTRNNIRIILILGSLCTAIFAISMLVSNAIIKYSSGLFLTLILSYFCVTELNKRVKFSDFLKSKFKKK